MGAPSLGRAEPPWPRVLSETGPQPCEGGGGAEAFLLPQPSGLRTLHPGHFRTRKAERRESREITQSSSLGQRPVLLFLPPRSKLYSATRGDSPPAPAVLLRRGCPLTQAPVARPAVRARAPRLLLSRRRSSVPGDVKPSPSRWCSRCGKRKCLWFPVSTPQPLTTDPGTC